MTSPAIVLSTSFGSQGSYPFPAIGRRQPSGRLSSQWGSHCYQISEMKKLHGVVFPKRPNIGSIQHQPLHSPLRGYTPPSGSSCRLIPGEAVKKASFPICLNRSCHRVYPVDCVYPLSFPGDVRPNAGMCMALCCVIICRMLGFSVCIHSLSHRLCIEQERLSILDPCRRSVGR